MLIGPQELIELVDRVGVFVFALSGGMVAVRHRMDVLGVMVVSLFPAIGGGTLRDLLLGVPVFWLTDQASLILALSAGLAAFFFANFWARLHALVWADAAGLALFAVVGASKAYTVDGSFLVSVFMGALTATAGGLIRDVVCNESPMLLREEVYATAAIADASTFWLAREAGMSEQEGLLTGSLVAFAVRTAGIVFKLRLPRPPAPPLG
jgi:uncharacterized membrane protein YeiH